MTAFVYNYTYNCIHLLNQYLGAFWPVKIFFGTKHLPPPSSDTENRVQRIFYLLHHKNDIAKFCFDIHEMIDALPVTEDVLSIHDKTMGYNLLQLAIIDGDLNLVKALLKWQFYNSNRQCSPPVHLAASLGHAIILECLLNNGARCNSSGGICYPDPHQPIKYKKWLGFLNQPVYKCNLNLRQPIYWAISRDNVNCFSLLQYHMVGNEEPIPDPKDLLYFACCRGAHDCIQKILSENSSIVNSVNTNGDSPLLLAVVWGKTCSKTLIDNGADVSIVSGIGETALHRLYRNDIDGLFTIYETTKYLLTTGIEQLINCKNHNFETPIHVLVTHVSYIGGSITNPDDLQSEIPRTLLQPEYQKQVVGTLELLLKFNADPGIQNSHGLDPMAKLMHIALKSCSPENEQPECVRTSINSMYRYRNEYSYLGKAVEVLLKHGSDINRCCPAGHSPLFLFLQCLLDDDVEHLCAQKNGVIQITHLLLENGALLEKSCENLTSILAKIASRFFQISTTDVLKYSELKCEYSGFVNSLLETFLKCGLDPNLVTDIKSRHLKGGIGNALIEFVRLTELARFPEDFSAILQWLKTLFGWGANPDIEPYPSDPIICHSQSSIFLKRQGTQAVSHYIHEVKEMDIFGNGNAQELLLLFYNTMSHEILYNCLNNARFMSHFHPLGATGKSFLRILNDLAENPRSLKQIARVQIYKSIDRQLVSKVPDLPLPTLLKNYLIEIQ